MTGRQKKYIEIVMLMRFKLKIFGVQNILKKIQNKLSTVWKIL